MSSVLACHRAPCTIPCWKCFQDYLYCTGASLWIVFQSRQASQQTLGCTGATSCWGAPTYDLYVTSWVRHSSLPLMKPGVTYSHLLCPAPRSCWQPAWAAPVCRVLQCTLSGMPGIRCWARDAASPGFRKHFSWFMTASVYSLYHVGN